MSASGLAWIQPVSNSSQDASPSTNQKHPQPPSKSTTVSAEDASIIARPEPALPSPVKTSGLLDEPSRSHSRVESTMSDWSSPGLESGFNSGAQTPATGSQTPHPLLSREQHNDNRADLLRAIDAIQEAGAETYEMERVRSRRLPSASPNRRASQDVPAASDPGPMASQGVPPELGSLWKEAVFVFVCSLGQLLFGFLLGDVTVTQSLFLDALEISHAQAPWLVGATLLANGLSVILSGSLADLARPKWMMVGAFGWLTLWSIVGAFSIVPSRKVLFFVVRAMQGLSVGILVSTCMSVLGRTYNPGLRKTRVFSCMASAAPFGFWVGCLQGGAFQYHLPWIFGSSAILCGIACAGAIYSIPPLKPAKDNMDSDAPSLRNFDFMGAGMAVIGCACLLFGLTQGTAAKWAPYTYTLVIIGLLVLVAFYFVEGRIARPLIPPRLWATPGFAPLLMAYFLGFGAYVGAWQYYAVQFFLNIQHKSSLITALYITPNMVVGVLATFIVSKTLHIFPGHVILTISMVAYSLGPVFFLPQTPNTTYWALSMPGIGLASFGPDLSFAAASIFITSQVPRSYQGSAGSLLVTTQNLSSAIFTAIADTIGSRVSVSPDGQIGLEGLRAAWWFGFGAAILGAVICAVFVRIPKTVEKEHEQ